MERCHAYGCAVYTYDGAVFNYARSLNQGFSYVEDQFCLVLSSHIEIRRPDLIDQMLTAFNDPVVKAIYVDFTKARFSAARNTITNFTGKNGIWNPCAMYSTAMAKALRFNEALPAAEDQDFALRLFRLGFATIELGGPWVRYTNPYTSPRKRNDAQVAIAYFIWPDNLSIMSIARRLAEAVRHLANGRRAEFVRLVCLSGRLFLARYREPQFEQASARAFKQPKGMRRRRGSTATAN